MIDIENYDYTQVRNAVITAFDNANCSSEYVDTPAAFPHVCIEMTENITHSPSMTAECREFASEQTFTVNIFTNTQTAKSDAKKIADTVDEVLSGLGFRRSQYLNTPNIERTIYRLTMRYTGLVSLAYDKAQGHFKITAR